MDTKKVPFLIALSLLVSACGSGLNSYHSEGLEQAGLVDGVLIIPSAGVSSGKSYISDDRSGFYIDLRGSEPGAIEYLNRLGARDIAVSKTEISGALYYSVRFSGTRDEGPCPFQPAHTCNRIQLKSLVAY